MIATGGVRYIFVVVSSPLLSLSGSIYPRWVEHSSDSGHHFLVEEQEDTRLPGMNTEETVVPSGQHYSGTNRIPNIKQFIESLDKDKKQRDAQIDSKLQSNSKTGEVQDHAEVKRSGKNRRTVRDPVTGRDVEIEDIGSNHMKLSENPVVRKKKNPPIVHSFRVMNEGVMQEWFRRANVLFLFPPRYS